MSFMARPPTSLTGVERSFKPDEIIVSKTDVRGHITYANRVFQRISGYAERELLGRPHSLIRHPHMPRCVFKFLWDTISAGQECFALVNNRCKNGDNYWVLAHVTPTYDAAGRIAGYHSSRRVPPRSAVRAIQPIYDQLLQIESRHQLPGDQWKASLPRLTEILATTGMPYDEFIFTLV
jgi:PAS domain S-box-containing protein